MPQIGSKGAELDLLIRQGATLGPVMSQLKNPDTSPMNITGRTIRAQIRRAPNQTLTPGATATCAIVDGANGWFSFEFTAAQTTALVAGINNEDEADSIYVWDCEIEDTFGRITPLLYGKVKVFREVTKAEA